MKTIVLTTLCFARVQHSSHLAFDFLLLFLLERLRPPFREDLYLHLCLLPCPLESDVSDDGSLLSDCDDDFESDSEESDELDESDNELEGSLVARPLPCLFGQF